MIGIAHASLGQADLATLLDCTGRAGVAVNIAPALVADASRNGASDDDLRRLAATSGARIHAIDPLLRDLPGSAPEDAVPPALRRFFGYGEEDCYRAAEVMSARALYVSHFLGRPVALTEIGDHIGAVAGRARAHGLATAIEFIPGTGIPDLSTAHAIAVHAGLGLASLVVDLWHFFRTGGRLAEIAALPAGSVHSIQLCDGPRSVIGGQVAPMTDRLLPGDGAWPVAAAVAALRANSPDARIEIEVIAARLRALPADQALRGLIGATQDWLDRHGVVA